MKKYRLLKDTVEVKAGTLFEYREVQERRVGDDTLRYIPAGYYVEGFIFDGQLSAPYYEKDVIENNTEWFGEVNGECEKLRIEEEINNLLDLFVDKFNINKEKNTITTRLFDKEIIVKKILDLIKKNTNSYKEIDLDAIKNSYQEMLNSRIRINTLPEINNNSQEERVIFKTFDDIICTNGDKIYGVAIQASGIDQWREQILPFKTPISESRVWFTNKEEANKYLIGNKRVFSYNDIVGFSIVKYGLSITGQKDLYLKAKERI